MERVKPKYACKRGSVTLMASLFLLKNVLSWHSVLLCIVKNKVNAATIFLQQLFKLAAILQFERLSWLNIRCCKYDRFFLHILQKKEFVALVASSTRFDFTLPMGITAIVDWNVLASLLSFTKKVIILLS